MLWSSSDKFDKQSVIQSLRNMDRMHTNLSRTSTSFSVLSTSQKPSQKLSQASFTSPSLSFSSTSSANSQGKANRHKCDFCSRLGHIEAKCFLKEKLMSQITSPSSPTVSPASRISQFTLQSTPSTTQSTLSQHFKLRDLGLTIQLLGLEIHRDRSNRLLLLSQGQYIANLLQDHGMQDCKPASAPLNPGLRLSTSMSPQNHAKCLRCTKCPISPLLDPL